MELRLTEEEMRLLLQLVYLGAVVVNGERRKPLTAYDALEEKVYAQVLAAGAVRAEKGRGIAGNETADLRDRLFDKVKDLLEEYERAVFRERLFTLAGASSLLYLWCTTPLHNPLNPLSVTITDFMKKPAYVVPIYWR